MSRLYVVISLFANLDRLGTAEIGRNNPWRRPNPVAELFGRLGINSTDDEGEELDPLFLVEGGQHLLGYAKVFEQEHPARYWFRVLRDQNNVWAFWRNGIPVEAMGGIETGSQDQYVQRMAIYLVTAPSKRAAAVISWKGFVSGTDALDRYQVDQS